MLLSDLGLHFLLYEVYSLTNIYLHTYDMLESVLGVREYMAVT